MNLSAKHTREHFSQTRPGGVCAKVKANSRLVWLLVVLGFLLTLPRNARGHGEVHIRINALTRQIETNQTPQLYLDRGDLHRQDQNWAAAEADYATASELDPGLIGVTFCRARLLADSGRLEEARRLFGQALEQTPANGEPLIGRARVQVRLHQPQAAIADYQRGLELLSQPAPEYFVELAQTLAAEGQAKQALRALDRGIEKLGPVLTLQIPAFDLEFAGKNYGAALVRLESILERAHRKENWLARRGDVLLAAGRRAEARKSYEETLLVIKTLPRLVQQGPAMVTLQNRVTAALTQITNSPIARHEP